MDQKTTRHEILVLCILYFIFCLHYALPVYMFSSFLSDWFEPGKMGLVYTLSAAVTVFGLILIIPIMKRFGNFKVTVTLLVLEFLALLGLSYIPSANAILLIFIVSFASVWMTWFSLDLFLEHFSRDKETGNIRGIYLTMGNLAWVIGPVTAFFILESGGYESVFLVSAALLLPTIFLLKHNLGTFKDPEYKVLKFWQGVKEVWADKNIRGVFAISFLLSLFFSWMVIYMPLYLTDYIGFSKEITGTIISLALIPFILVDFPLGWVADKKLGEKEILIAGFIIMALSTMAIYFINVPNALLWATLLFVTRIGAASIEVMSDTYLFKQIDASRVNVLSLFRVTRPVAYVVAPMLATVVFLAMDINATFLALGILMLLGVFFSLSIKDTN